MEPEIDRHFDEEEIERYSRGDVHEGELGRFEEHLLICETCRRRVAQSDVYIGAMRRAAAELRRKKQVGACKEKAGKRK
jgi:anti-sigma factor RsiW